MNNKTILIKKIYFDNINTNNTKIKRVPNTNLKNNKKITTILIPNTKTNIINKLTTNLKISTT